jgi:hypothetical protein
MEGAPNDRLQFSLQFLMAVLIAGREREKRGRWRTQTVKIIPFALAADVPGEVRVVSK